MTNEERALLDLGIPAAVIIVLLNHDSGFTQAQLAALLGVSRQSVGRALLLLERHAKVTPQPIPPGSPLRRTSRYIYRWSGGPAMGGAA